MTYTIDSGNGGSLDSRVETLMIGLKILSGEQHTPGYEFAWNATTYNPDDLWATLNTLDAEARKSGAQLPDELPYLTVLSYANVAKSTLETFNEQIERAKEHGFYEAEDEFDLSWKDYLIRNVENAIELMDTELGSYLRSTGVDLSAFEHEQNAIPENATLSDSYAAFSEAFGRIQTYEGPDAHDDVVSAYRAGMRFLDHAQITLDAKRIEHE